MHTRCCIMKSVDGTGTVWVTVVKSDARVYPLRGDVKSAPGFFCAMDRRDDEDEEMNRER